MKLTKNELRDQQRKLTQLEKYLPTLQLKKSLLQVEVNNTGHEMAALSEQKEKAKSKVKEFASLLSKVKGLNLEKLIEVAHLNKTYENIAGVEIPKFIEAQFPKDDFYLFDTPVWLDSALKYLRELVEIKEQIQVVLEKKRALEKELREVSIRVNLFEKILIPRCKEGIKKIKVFLGDQELAAVSQAKVAKRKLEEKRLA